MTELDLESKPTKYSKHGGFITITDQEPDQEPKIIEERIHAEVDAFIRDLDKLAVSLGKHATYEVLDIQYINYRPGSDPLNIKTCFGWKVHIQGRAFLIDKLNHLDRWPRHSFRKKVPKKKRGRRIMTLYRKKVRDSNNEDKKQISG